ncbi:hypothetical protein SAMN04487775_102128 [Treponema bryantii]|uniref:Uncharacterized protein n=1 Tax=Treponema bryantii TaxID=163 RepID=A0A1I3ITV0_9SPIR|nr:hypothetical protein [Treponema bryantii]SFI51307.1 hypothetical protein SAMN04487775_102128 [Treponema bryantii]
MGLLSRASNLDKAEHIPGLAFSDFINKHSLKICALLEKHASNYIVTNSVGFDAQSIFTATSTIDFWAGICKETGHIYNLSGSSLTPLLQLFSFNLKDSLSELSVYKNSSEQILICKEKLSEEAAKDFENIESTEHINNVYTLNSLLKNGSEVLLFNVDIEQAVKEVYQSENKDNSVNYDDFLKAVLNETYNRFTCIYSIPDTTIKSNLHSVKTVFITEKAYSTELIKNHIVLNLNDLFNEASDKLKINFVDKADSCEKIQSFLQVE